MGGHVMTRVWRCILQCYKPSGSIYVTVGIEDLNEHFCLSECKSLLTIKRSSIMCGVLHVRSIYDIEDGYMIVHYSRNSPTHMSQEIRELVEPYKPPIYVI